MKKILYFCFFAVLLGPLAARAQNQAAPDSLREETNLLPDSLRKPQEAKVDTFWKKKAEFGLNLNQGSFSDNWTGGAVNSIAVGANFSFRIKYKKDKNSWRNDLQAQYGIVRNKGQQSRKSVDRLFFDTEYGRELSDQWNLVASANLLTQFTEGYEFEELPSGEEQRRQVSGWFSPAFLTESIGLEYEPNDYFHISLSPAALRQTFVTDLDLYKTFPKNYGVPVGQKVRSEFAAQLVANLDKDVFKNVNLKARYVLFANYRTLDAIDNRLDATLTAKVNKYLNFNIGTIVIYDENQSTKIQFAQSLSVGFLYTF